MTVVSRAAQAKNLHDCGCVARCALEAYDSGDVRIEKILDIIDQCKLGIHDISRTELNEHSLPRFNMPLELARISQCAVRNAHGVPTFVGVSRESFRPGKLLPKQLATGDLLTIEKFVRRSG